ncbi:TetR family transcriptional regulator [Burkholderia lata]|nr:TetR family transcriptional regulator [Burkholderia lata]
MKKGYVAASVEDIAAAAGFTRGAFYSNFSSKSDLLLELLERDHAEVQADFQAIFDGGGTREQMESMSLAYYRTLFQDDEYSLL